MGRVRRAAVFRMVMGRGGWNETGWNNGECGN